jgi:lipopolysaccharide biosynthesis glycosyltransferase
MKYVYVLVSDEHDFYYEQALMSLTSMRFYMPQAEIIVLTDDRTEISFTGKRTELHKLATRIISVSFQEKVKCIERSRLIKTAIPDYITGDFLYIDCDTIICDSLTDIDAFPYEIAGVLDGHVMLEEHIHKNYFLDRDKKLGFSGTKAAGCNFNGGLLLARDTPLMHEFFHQWNIAWKYSAYRKHDLHDQSALNEANYRSGLKLRQLPGEWNCQPCHGGLAFLQHAKILHYYASEIKSGNYLPYYKLADKQLQQRIKETGSIPDDIEKMLREPKFQFNRVHIISDQRIVNIMQSPLLFTLADFKIHCPALFSALEFFAGCLRSFGHIFKHRSRRVWKK